MVEETTRMERAQATTTSDVTQLSPKTGWVESQSTDGKTYTVDLRGEPSCTCPDHRYRGVNCKHIAAFASHIGEFDL